MNHTLSLIYFVNNWQVSFPQQVWYSVSDPFHTLLPSANAWIRMPFFRPYNSLECIIHLYFLTAYCAWKYFVRVPFPQRCGMFESFESAGDRAPQHLSVIIVEFSKLLRENTDIHLQLSRFYILRPEHTWKTSCSLLGEQKNALATSLNSKLPNLLSCFKSMQTPSKCESKFVRGRPTLFYWITGLKDWQNFTQTLRLYWYLPYGSDEWKLSPQSVKNSSLQPSPFITAMITLRCSVLAGGECTADIRKLQMTQMRFQIQQNKAAHANGQF